MGTKAVAVTGEYYRVSLGDGGVGGLPARRPLPVRYKGPRDALRAGFVEMIDGWKTVYVQRVTEHETVGEDAEIALWADDGPRSETVTGEILIPTPGAYEWTPELSRYSPVNGWVVPDTINVED
jgi:hypothetical protein